MFAQEVTISAEFRAGGGGRGLPMLYVNYYWSFYKNFFLRAWNNISPTQYGLLLVAVAVIGYMLMKSGAKSHS